ncbi:MAG: GNAT family N-acetyltransferase [Promicromonosporaceae bacterium]|nr:GNAT family N-acetyltransferase [Promicromonosporaceae bacterium]
MDPAGTEVEVDGGALLLRPWRPADAPALVEISRDAALRRWTSASVDDEAGAARWIEGRRLGWETGRSLGFAVVEPEADAIVGHVVLKGMAPGATGAEVGYWTAAPARGRAVAPRAVDALAAWAFATFPALGHLDLLHQVDNAASCRVAQKCGFALRAVLPADPPAYPLDGHRHVRPA